jgi:hypothetical protein
MSIFIRFIILATCAYGGSVLAGRQFSDLPADPDQLTQR